MDNGTFISLRLCCLAGLCLIGCFVTHAQTAGATGTILGVVQLDQRAPLPGGEVVYHRLNKLGRDANGHLIVLEPPVSGSVHSRGDGSFKIGGLPPGEYYLCAIGVARNHLRSCTADVGHAVVEPGGTTNIQLSVITGAMVTVDVADPGGKVKARNLLVGFTTPAGSYYASAPVSRAGNSAVYLIAVPKGSRGRLLIDGALTVLEDSGSPVTLHRPSIPVSLDGNDGAAVHLRVN